MKILLFVCIAAGVGLTGAEVFQIYDALHEASRAQMVAGMAASIAVPLLGLIVRENKLLGYPALALLLFAVLVFSGARIGQGMDKAEQARATARRASSAVQDVAGELKGALDDAKADKKTACVRAKSDACKDAKKKVETLLGKYEGAGTKMAETPVVAGEGNTTRLAAAFHVSEQTVLVYLPFLLPIGLAIGGAAFFNGAERIWHGMPRKTVAPIARTAEPNPAAVLRQIVRPADIQSRVEIEELVGAYLEACRRAGEPVAPLAVFGPQAKAFADARQIRVVVSDGKVYWHGVKLAG